MAIEEKTPRKAKRSERKLVYLEHPVSAEQKAEAMAAGYRIIDARFDPDRAKPEVKAEMTPAEKRAATIAAKAAAKASPAADADADTKAKAASAADADAAAMAAASK